MKRRSTAKRTGSTSYRTTTSNTGPWSEQEDKKLIDLVDKYGAEKWSYISSFFPERIGKQCRERWFNHLSPQVKKTSWIKEEEWILFLMHRKLGNKWSKLCEFLPGRTDNTIKNHWNSTMQKKINCIEEEYNEIIKDKSQEEIENINNDIIAKCTKVINNDNEKFYDEKNKIYEKFKSLKVENKQSISKLKKILLFRTHSKKTKKRGRKRKLIPIKPITSSIKRKKISIEDVTLNYEYSPNESDKKLTTPVKQADSQSESATLQIEKSAFNKHIVPSTTNDNYSNIKTHLLFTSSIKKPVKIISDDNLLSTSIKMSTNAMYSNQNDFFTSNENMTPNKQFDALSYSDTFKKNNFNYKSILTSNKKYEGLNLFSNTFIESTPYKINNANLDKMFFSVIQNDYDSTPIKKS